MRTTASALTPAGSSLRSLGLVLVVVAITGCVSSPPALSPRPTADAFDGVRRIIIVASGESRFAVAQSSKEPAREFEEVAKWLPYKEIVVPIARAVYWGITWLLDTARASDTVPQGVTPGAVVADAFARRLQVGGGAFDQIVATDREPVGEARRNADAILRLSVPSWGLVRVRESAPPLVAAFADVRAEMVLRETGVVVWQHEEDVTHPEELPLEALTGDRALAREQLTGVLERAGRRLANEFVYARSGGQ
jgi:hypothetical protein